MQVVKAVKEYIAGSVYLQKVNYTTACIRHRSVGPKAFHPSLMMTNL